MTRATAKSTIQPCPSPVVSAEVPTHLRGSRAALFHLLRQPHAVQNPKPPAPPQARPAAVKQIARPSPNNIELRAFIQEDQFEFLSVEARGEAVRSVATSRNRLAS